jgi:hypothetical protein
MVPGLNIPRTILESNMADLVLEFHYDGGDVGAHEIDADADLNNFIDLATWNDDLTHVIIRKNNKAGQKLSTALHVSAAQLRKG